MNWKTDLRLADLDACTLLEATCKRCGHTRYERQSELVRWPELARGHLDEIEKALRCLKADCSGGVRIALLHDDRVEAWDDEMMMI
ncbi:MAG TPA: hypothetical protein VME69_02025 [Methylocella sp.]|nr:hypothetical protein [Methylocella sp.]